MVINAIEVERWAADLPYETGILIEIRDALSDVEAQIKALQKKRSDLLRRLASVHD